MPVQSALIYLIGFPAAGKLTIGRCLTEMARAAGMPTVLVDNHHINNVVFEVIETDGKRSLPPRVWELIAGVRRSVLTAIEELAPPSWSYVFTNVLLAGMDERYLDEFAALAASRDSVFVPVTLRCEIDELARRIVSEERRSRLKWVDPEALRALVASAELCDTSAFPHALEIDVTARQPDDVARDVLDHVERIASAPRSR